jgi:hypothetical protein
MAPPVNYYLLGYCPSACPGLFSKIQYKKNIGRKLEYRREMIF